MQFMTVKTSQFFNTKKVMNLVNKATHRALMGAGALIRTTAKRSMRTRKDPDKASPAGTPPFAHNKKLKRSILFGYDMASESVVIGPSASFGGSDIPALHEFGGTKQIEIKGGGVVYVGMEARIGNRKFKVKTEAEARALAKFYGWKYSEKPSRRGKVLARFPARPYMAPALTKMIPVIRQEFPKTFGEAWKSPI